MFHQVHIFYGIIDILQSWRLYKQTEHALKTVRFATQRGGVSVTDPQSYADRFRTKLIARFVPEEQVPKNSQKSAVTFTGTRQPEENAVALVAARHAYQAMEMKHASSLRSDHI